MFRIYKNKYNNKKVEYDGHMFDSQKECTRYKQLRLLERTGLIKDLELQKEYILQDKYKINNKTIRKISYIADFSYISVKDNKLHVIDVKGFKTDVYKLKKKLFEYKYGIEIEEV